MGLGRRGPPLSRCDGRAVVRERRLWAARDRGCGIRPDGPAALLSADAVAWAGRETGGPVDIAAAPRVDARLLPQQRIGGRRDGAQDRAAIRPADASRTEPVQNYRAAS